MNIKKFQLASMYCFIGGLFIASSFEYNKPEAKIVKEVNKATIEDFKSANVDLVLTDYVSSIEDRHLELVGMSALNYCVEEISNDIVIKRLSTEEVTEEAAEEVTKEVTEEVTEEVTTEIELQANYDEVASNVPNWKEGCISEKITFMDYRAVTCQTSNQWKLLRSDECYTGNRGIRMIGDRYCIAVGTYYAPSVGTKLDLVMADGSVLKCIVGDFKADHDTDSNNQFQAYDGSVAEFIIDGEVFYDTSQYPEECGQEIIKIVQVE